MIERPEMGKPSLIVTGAFLYSPVMFNARALSGLPPYGPAALSFPRADAIREGFVVEFVSELGETWIGNFAKGNGSESSIHPELGPSATVVVASGAGYLVDTKERCLVREIGFDLQQVWFVAEMNAIVVLNGLWFEAFDARDVVWRSRRFSWDGTQNVSRDGIWIAGEAFDPTTDVWLPFRLDLTSGSVEGGSYDGPN
ncbi:hypothetical protein [Sphingomonas solaris]|uniref:Uncharacterized protein n=1 Tax=Alterirhizorhabdus solaris TaxID=2529389 RepID=A0A558QYW4_9SPHN|nr:hypothetical protein [Sphingomonas solaris]TVV72298.1 hypothetical protein FOY91_14840 [Sphingomonas solaris]